MKDYCIFLEILNLREKSIFPRKTYWLFEIAAAFLIKSIVFFRDYFEFAELKTDFVEGRISEEQLKEPLVNFLNDLLEKVRQ